MYCELICTYDDSYLLSSDVFLGVKNGQNESAAGALHRTPLGELTALLRPPSRGVAMGSIPVYIPSKSGYLKKITWLFFSCDP